MSRKTEFKVDMAKAIKGIEDDVEETIRLAALGLFTAILYKTPVDTGHLAYNWQASVDNPNQSEKSGVDPSKSSTLEEIKSNVNKWTLKNKSLWLANNVEYAEDVEYGKSRVKAPQGMVRVSLREFDSIFKGAAMTVNKGTGSKGNRYR